MATERVGKSLRPTLRDSDAPGLSYKTTYLRVLESVKQRRVLIHGELHNDHHSCAIGCYFRDAHIPIDSAALEEIAAYNDSFPKLSQHARWKKVMTWLKLQVKLLYLNSRERRGRTA